MKERVDGMMTSSHPYGLDDNFMDHERQCFQMFVKKLVNVGAKIDYKDFLYVIDKASLDCMEDLLSNIGKDIKLEYKDVKELSSDKIFYLANRKNINRDTLESICAGYKTAEIDNMKEAIDKKYDNIGKKLDNPLSTEFKELLDDKKVRNADTQTKLNYVLGKTMKKRVNYMMSNLFAKGKEFMDHGYQFIQEKLVSVGAKIDNKDFIYVIDKASLDCMEDLLSNIGKDIKLQYDDIRRISFDKILYLADRKNVDINTLDYIFRARKRVIECNIDDNSSTYNVLLGLTILTGLISIVLLSLLFLKVIPMVPSLIIAFAILSPILPIGFGLIAKAIYIDLKTCKSNLTVFENEYSPKLTDIKRKFATIHSSELPGVSPMLQHNQVGDDKESSVQQVTGIRNK